MSCSKAQSGIDRHLTSYPEADLHRPPSLRPGGWPGGRQSVTIKSRVPLAAGNSSPNLTLIHGREAATGGRNPAERLNARRRPIWKKRISAIERALSRPFAKIALDPDLESEYQGRTDRQRRTTIAGVATRSRSCKPRLPAAGLSRGPAGTGIDAAARPRDTAIPAGDPGSVSWNERGPERCCSSAAGLLCRCRHLSGSSGRLAPQRPLPHGDRPPAHLHEHRRSSIPAPGPDGHIVVGRGNAGAGVFSSEDRMRISSPCARLSQAYPSCLSSSAFGPRRHRGTHS